MEAVTREEKIISGENLTPITRKELFLAKASGQDIQTPTPITREEMFLSKISGGGDIKEGTAIPVGVPVDKIYFNTNLHSIEAREYLQRLTYRGIGLDFPAYIIFASHSNFLISILTDQGPMLVHNTVPAFDGNEIIIFSNRKGWDTITRKKMVEDEEEVGFVDIAVSYMAFANLKLVSGEFSLTELNGIPIGSENEKIKNVVSITPF